MTHRNKMTGPSMPRRTAGERRPDIPLDFKSYNGPPLPEVMSGPDLASLLGIADRTLRELAKDGTFPRRKRGLYAFRESVCGSAARLRETASGRGGEALAATLTAERAALAREQTAAIALKNSEKRGELVPKAQVLSTWAGMLTDIRAALLAVPERAASRAALSREATEIIAAEIRETLEALAGD